MSSCGHCWDPVPTWGARYRCRWCKALAYKNFVNGGAKGKPDHLNVYICQHQGCQEPAITAGRFLQRCAVHQPEYRVVPLPLTIR